MSNVLARCFVGSNNDTHALEFDAIEAIATSAFPDGVTIYRVRGAWKSDTLTCQEDTACIERIGNDAELRGAWRALAASLKVQLKQEAILIQFLPVETEFV